MLFRLSLSIVLFLIPQVYSECLAVSGRLVCRKNPQAVASVPIYLWDFEVHDIFNLAARGEDSFIANNVTDERGNYYLAGCQLDMDMGFGNDPPDPYFRFYHYCNGQPQLYEHFVESPLFSRQGVEPQMTHYRDIVLDDIGETMLESWRHQFMGNP